MCLCLSVTTLAATAFVHEHKVKYHRLLYDDFLDFDSRVSPKRLISGCLLASYPGLSLKGPGPGTRLDVYDRGHQASLYRNYISRS